YQVSKGKKNFFCNLSCAASYRNRNNPNNPPDPQYGNQYGRKYPNEVSWYATRCFKDQRFGLMEHSVRLSFANHLLEKLKEQKGRCAFTNISLSLRDVQGKVHEDNPFKIASVDRINNSLPYQEGNVQWTSVAMNFARNRTELEEFKECLQEFLAACATQNFTT
ncbi:hypothetical protein LCGC14_1987750, partial [marine sediment metagenome]